MQKMDIGGKYVEKRIKRRITIREIEDESATSRQKQHSTKRRKREDLLTFYLCKQDERNQRSSVNEANHIFTLPCSDSLRRDIEILQRFIKMHEPSGEVVHEEVVIVTDETEVTKKADTTEN